MRLSSAPVLTSSQNDNPQAGLSTGLGSDRFTFVRRSCREQTLMNMSSTGFRLLHAAVFVLLQGLLPSCSGKRDPHYDSENIPGVILIDDGDDGDNTTLKNGQGFIGFWYTFDDRCDCENGDPTGETTPTPAPLGGGKFSMTRHSAPGGVALAPEGEQSANAYGIRVQGGGHSTFGAGVGVGLNNQSGSLLPFDLQTQGWNALRFWARNGVGPVELRVRVSDVYSEPAGSHCQPRPEEQSWCDGGWDGESCAKQGCFDSPTTTIKVGTDWKLYEIPFSNLMRENWGIPRDGLDSPPLSLAADRAYQVQFALPANVPQFDLWLDNVGFKLANEDGE